jgi:hypothetical protein
MIHSPRNLRPHSPGQPSFHRFQAQLPFTAKMAALMLVCLTIRSFSTGQENSSPLVILGEGRQLRGGVSVPDTSILIPTETESSMSSEDEAHADDDMWAADQSADKDLQPLALQELMLEFNMNPRFDTTKRTKGQSELSDLR